MAFGPILALSRFGMGVYLRRVWHVYNVFGAFLALLALIWQIGEGAMAKTPAVLVLPGIANSKNNNGGGEGEDNHRNSEWWIDAEKEQWPKWGRKEEVWEGQNMARKAKVQGGAKTEPGSWTLLGQLWIQVEVAIIYSNFLDKNGTTELRTIRDNLESKPADWGQIGAMENEKLAEIDKLDQK